jgi:hypothetical protein
MSPAGPTASCSGGVGGDRQDAALLVYLRDASIAEAVGPNLAAGLVEQRPTLGRAHCIESVEQVADREQAGSSPAEHELPHDAVLVVGQVSGQFAHGRQRVLAMTEGDLDAPVAHAVAPSRSVAAANASSASRNAAAAVAMLTA